MSEWLKCEDQSTLAPGHWESRAGMEDQLEPVVVQEAPGNGGEEGRGTAVCLSCQNEDMVLRMISYTSSSGSMYTRGLTFLNYFVHFHKYLEKLHDY